MNIDVQYLLKKQLKQNSKNVNFGKYGSLNRNLRGPCLFFAFLNRNVYI